ncbi:H+- or Na+-translocating F-type, V-type and A-type ATPase (F-ATPase) Superfamily [Pseudoloma neurophilia]|uniref:H+-or Na+-translocating F-type, V-type and A-type ATPase (F-ATPase) Superfamily n=1 Tax=Pseudoloma neurophilia TaxID=146866 RepID=A0A0R0MAM0_9MICR|nr:H+- or Na+-translocating F-type, V-type and A-type ATPase (F-ATPase) Superfamily [Pseudoloma neurophilia]
MDSATVPSSSGGSPFEQFLSKENISLIVSNSSLLALTLPALAGTGLGLKECAVGISAAAEIKSEFSSVMAMLCFLTTPMIYMILLFFMVKNIKGELFSDALMKFTSCFITGIGSYFTAYTIGCMAKYVLVTKVKEKKFTGQFYLGFVFVEFVGLFALIISLMLRSSITTENK